MRNVKTEYVSCPSCGRTLFDLQTVTAEASTHKWMRAPTHARTHMILHDWYTPRCLEPGARQRESSRARTPPSHLGLVAVCTGRNSNKAASARMAITLSLGSAHLSLAISYLKP